MHQKIQAIKNEYQQIQEKLNSPEIISDMKKMAELGKRQAEMTEVMSVIFELEKTAKEMRENAEIVNMEKDPEMKQMAMDENIKLSPRKEELEKKLEQLLLPKDPNDNKNVIVEIRAGAGGDESALFAGSLFRMYSRFAENQGWHISLLNSHQTGIGGFKEVIFEINGTDVYGKMKYESGVHRVQRVPETEKMGRIHTSTATVAVLPEIEEVEFKINENDLRIDTFCSSGPGGQSVNTTKSAIRITHIPSGLVVSCQDEKSQHKNKAKALKVLRSRLFDLKQQEQAQQIAQERRSQVGTGDRSERIRTYNFPQGRITDHRVGLTLYRLENILDGDLDEFLQALTTHFRSLALQQA